MNACPSLSAQGADGIASALRVVDCRTAQATAAAFDRLFGADGRLLTALTLMMTIYVALLAIGLLTGRTRLGVSALTPRMLTLGLILTFATSWAAYQSVIWNLASGAPDQIATFLIGTRGSATSAFANRLDQLFATVADAARQAGQPGAPTETGITPAATTVGGFSASTVLWLSATMLLLGTVGVLLTSKIALAALLALGPVFIVFALFRGTRSLFEGWLKATTLFALVPLLTVLIGGGGISLMDPLVRGVEVAGSDPPAQQVAAVFLAASVFVALMVIVLKTAGTLVSGWRLPFEPQAQASPQQGAGSPAPAMSSNASHISAIASDGPRQLSSDERVRAVAAALPVPSGQQADHGAGGGRVRRVSAEIVPLAPAAQKGGDRRVQSLQAGRAVRGRVNGRERIS